MGFWCAARNTENGCDGAFLVAMTGPHARTAKGKTITPEQPAGKQRHRRRRRRCKVAL